MSEKPNQVELLRIVRKGDAARAVAVQIGVTMAATLLLSGGHAIGAGFNVVDKQNQRGTEIDAASEQERTVLDNPARAELAGVLGFHLRRMYLDRIPPEASLPVGFQPPIQVSSTQWRLIYESPVNGVEVFKLQWAAEVARNDGARAGEGQPINTLCWHQSADALSLEQWREDGWRRLRMERAQAFNNCLGIVLSRLPNML